MVQSIDRAFSILDVVAAAQEGISVTEAARQVGLPLSTVSRLIITLEQLGAVERLKNERVRIGERIARLSSQLSWNDKLIRLARPHLENLAASIGEDAALVIPDGFDAHFIDQVSGGQVIQVQDWTGTKFPMHTLSAGKVFLAFQEEKLERYLKQPLIAFTSKTLSKPEALRKNLRQIKAQGYSWSFGEFADNLNALSVPIFSQGQIVASLTLYGPGFRFPAEHQAKITQDLLLRSKAISMGLEA